MEVVNQTPFEFVFFPGRMEYPRHSITVVAKGTYDLLPNVALPLAEEQIPISGDVPYPGEEDEDTSLWYESDFAPFKPAADAVLVGRCYVPGGQSAPTCTVSFQVGQRVHTLRVSGERLWKKGFLSTKATDPQMFQELDLRYESSYGGPGFEFNPVGKGIRILDVDGHRIQLLPNIEDPRFKLDSPKAQAPPAGFGPVSRSWGQRVRKMGTYGKAWLKQRSPWFPEDLDWGTFNCAPVDMQFPEYLRGDEEVALVNLHRKHEKLFCRLPGQRTRCFLFDRPAEPQGRLTFRELTMKLDTLWIDTESGKVVLTWRGHANVRSNEFEDVSHLFLVDENMAQPPTANELWEAQLRDVIRREQVDADSNPDEEVSVPAVTETRSEAAPDSEEDEVPEDPLLSGDGTDTTPLPEKLSPEERITMGRIMLALGHSEAELFDVGLTPEDILPDSPEERRIRAELLKELNLAPIEPDEPSKSAEKSRRDREWVTERANSGQSFEGEDLSRLDLSGLVLEGKDLSGANFFGAILLGAKLNGCDLTGADFSRADLSGMELRDAKLVEARFDGATLNRAILVGAELEGAVLRKAVLAEADLREIKAAEVDFVETDLRKANLEGAMLAGASFPGSTLDSTLFNGADLQDANLSGASSEGGTRFDKANLSGAEIGVGTSLVGASFREIEAPGSVWSTAILTGSDFSHAKLTEADFSKATLDGATLYAVHGKKSTFYKTRLRAAKLTKSDFFHAVFEFADLTEADFTGSNLYGAILSDTQRDRIVLRDTLLGDTALEPA